MNRFFAGLILFAFYSCNSNESEQTESDVVNFESVVLNKSQDSIDIISTELLDSLQMDSLADVNMVEDMIIEPIKPKNPKKKSDSEDKKNHLNPFNDVSSGTGNGPFSFGGNDDGGVGNGDGAGKGGFGNGFNPSRKLIFTGEKPEQTAEEGIVAYDIWVNTAGDVVKIRLNRAYSNTTNEDLISLAKKWAHTMKYEVSSNSNQQEFVGRQLFEFKADSLH